MFDYFIHTPIFCCILGGLTVPLIQQIETLENEKESILPGFRFVRFIRSVLLHVTISAIAGFILFDTYALDLKVMYFCTGAASPFLLNRLIYIRRDLMHNVKKKEKKALYKVMG